MTYIISFPTLAIVIGAFALNGIVAVGLLRYGYRRRGWEEYRAKCAWP